MRTLILASIVTASLALTGCAGFAFSGKPTGFAGLYADTKLNEQVTQNRLGAKRGEACASSILGIVTTGDASASSAARMGGITTVASVDNSFTNILGIYSKYCVQVTGE